MTDEPPWIWPRAAYVHVPFCAHHCGYCDFAIAVGHDDRIEPYVEALSAEMSRLGTPQPVRTLFLGGGTPTHLPPGPLGRLLAAVRHWHPTEGDDVSAEEFSIEANPDTLDDDRVAVLVEHGVTRVSLGAQSFHPHLLRVLDRTHNAEQVPRAVKHVRDRGMQVSLDLIFGVPGQSLAEWREDLRRAITLEPDHVSTYGLTYEKGTPLWKQRRHGAIVPLSEDAELEMYRSAIDTLEDAGYEQYEISNFARPGRRSRHNETYWLNQAYFGHGMGAARYVRGRRELNTRDLLTYLRRCQAGEPATMQSEQLPPAERARETMAVMLRRRDGIDCAQFRVQTGFDLHGLAAEKLGRLVEQGLIEKHGSNVRLTRPGQYVADAVIQHLL
jgi:oxygen-independent coproporphyrinogen-3 oxidase